MTRLFPLALVALAACDPAQMADDATRRAAAEVVQSVVIKDMPAPQAKAATECILQAATPPEQRGIARNFGAVVGPQTVDNIRTLARRPAVQACFASAGVPPVLG